MSIPRSAILKTRVLQRATSSSACSPLAVRAVAATLFCAVVDFGSRKTLDACDAGFLHDVVSLEDFFLGCHWVLSVSVPMPAAGLHFGRQQKAASRALEAGLRDLHQRFSAMGCHRDSN